MALSNRLGGEEEAGGAREEGEGSAGCSTSVPCLAIAPGRVGKGGAAASRLPGGGQAEQDVLAGRTAKREGRTCPNGRWTGQGSGREATHCPAGSLDWTAAAPLDILGERGRERLGGKGREEGVLGEGQVVEALQPAFLCAGARAGARWADNSAPPRKRPLAPSLGCPTPDRESDGRRPIQRPGATADQRERVSQRDSGTGTSGGRRDASARGIALLAGLMGAGSSRPRADTCTRARSARRAGVRPSLAASLGIAHGCPPQTRRRRRRRRVPCYRRRAFLRFLTGVSSSSLSSSSVSSTSSSSSLSSFTSGSAISSSSSPSVPVSELPLSPTTSFPASAACREGGEPVGGEREPAECRRRASTSESNEPFSGRWNVDRSGSGGGGGERGGEGKGGVI